MSNPSKKFFRKIYNALDIQYLAQAKKFMFAKTSEDAGYANSIESDLKKTIRSPLKYAFIAIGVGSFFFLIWGGLAPLDSAAIAEGVISLSGNHKTIQHLEGGVIESLNAKDGQEVIAGEALLTLNDSSAKARLQVVKGQLNYALAVGVRLKTEQEGLDHLVYSPTLFDVNDKDFQQVMKTQHNLFLARQQVIRGQRSILNERIAQNQEQIIGLEAQLKSAESQRNSIAGEVASTQDLFKKGLALKPRLLELQRNLDALIGRIGEIQSSIASTKQAISEMQFQILNIDNEFQKEIAAELKENHSNILELTEQYNAAKDVLDRTRIKAPVNGIVTDLQYHTIGGVISPGSKILDIIPQDDKLIIEAKVRTQDIDSIHVGLVTKVQLGAFKSRLVPRLDGKVIYVSADKLVEQQTGMPYYLAKVEIDDSELKSLTADIKLYPGMPVTIFIVKGTRTFLQYLISPIMDSFYKAFKEA